VVTKASDANVFKEGYVTLPKEGGGRGLRKKIMQERKQNGKRKPKGKELNYR